jgi:dipeptidase D
VREKASAGRENAAIVAVQCHLDMVCEKNSDVSHDFARDPVAVKRSGAFIMANGTTLGADNGIGVAAALAMMEDKTLVHGPLEFIFTVDEETGLSGAAALRSADVRSRILINLDTEEEGVLYVGCAGGCDSTGTLAAARDALPAQHVLYTLRVSGLRGGHSGIDIHAGRANAIKLLCRALAALVGNGVRLCRLTGGNKRNAIPREAEALVAIPAAEAGTARKIVSELGRTFKGEYAEADPGVALLLTPFEGKKTGIRVLEKDVQRRLVNLLGVLPHGVIAMSRDIPGLVETSTNLARVTMEKDSVLIETSQRSSVESAKNKIVRTVEERFSLAGATVKHSDGYPGWKPDLQSPILKTARETYRRLFGKEPAVKAVHAGLECGVIGEKFPGMDMISIGPTIEMAHSPEERVNSDSVKKFSDFLAAILETVSG